MSVSTATFAVSVHFLIRFMAALSCPRSKDSVMYTTRRSGPATVLALNEKLPAALALVNTDTDSVENLTSGVNVVLSTPLDSVAPMCTKIRLASRASPWFTDITRA